MLDLLRKIVPRKLLVWVRLFSIYQGLWNHTPKKGQYLQDANGRHIPWITYGAIEFLSSLDFSDCRVLEYGSGSSTLYWSKKAKQVFSVERDLPWFEKLKPVLPSNCTLIHEGDELKYPNRITEFNSLFDVVILDGAVRFPCMEAALDLLHASGIFILDNLEWYPRLASHLRQLGFYEIDFAGLTPQNAFTSCTSIFFRDPSFLKRRIEIPEWKPLGGRYLLAHDDMPMSQINPNVLVRN